jgi:hypothetical protein
VHAQLVEAALAVARGEARAHGRKLHVGVAQPAVLQRPRDGDLGVLGVLRVVPREALQRLAEAGHADADDIHRGGHVVGSRRTTFVLSVRTMIIRR